MTGRTTRRRKAKTRKPRRRQATPTALSPFLRSAGLTRREERALEAAIVRFGSRPEVAAVDFGYKWKAGRMRKTLCLRIHLREKVPVRLLARRERIPRRFLGIPTDVIEAPHRPQATPVPPWIDRAAVLRPGVSIGTSAGPAGTLGLLVRDSDDNGAPGLLTAAHVLTGDPTAGPGEPVLQPARGDGGQPQDTIGDLRRVDFETDAALARVFDTRPRDPAAEGSGNVVAGLRFAAYDMVLEKAGRSTGVTQGIVDGLTEFGWGLRFVIHIVPRPQSPGPIADLGDSGAVWYEPRSGDAVGLHCQGALNALTGSSFAIATSIPHLFPRLRVTL